MHLPGRPVVTIEDAARIAAETFGWQGVQAEELPSDRDRNFRVRGDGHDGVLKVCNAHEDTGVLDLQDQALHTLANVEGLPSAQLVPPVATHGRAFVELAGERHAVRLVTWLQGIPLAHARPIDAPLLHEIGAALAQVHRAFLTLPPAPSASSGTARDFDWDLLQGARVMERDLADLPDNRSTIVATILERLRAVDLDALPRQWLHNDANDHNVLVALGGTTLTFAGLIDLGDMAFSARVADLAIAAAYIVLDAPDPLPRLAALTQGYCSVGTLTDTELDALWPLTLARLGVSVCMAARQRAIEPDNDYLSVTEGPAWRSLPDLLALPPALATAFARSGAGLEPCANAAIVREWLHERRGSFPSLLQGHDVHTWPMLSCAVDSDGLETANAPGTLGYYGEARLAYAGDNFATATGERRTVHLGVDLMAAADTPVVAPTGGTIEFAHDNDIPGDYGATIALRHEPTDGPTFWTLYGHLSRASLAGKKAGDTVSQGDTFATLGAPEENGGWPPHLHFQVMTDLLGETHNYAGVCAPSTRAVWDSLVLDPSDIVGRDVGIERDEAGGIHERRRTRLASNLSLSYQSPLHIVRGDGAYLISKQGQSYLDLVNNVCHVGHANPRVVAALSRQAATLNTNTRYLHDNIVRYAEKLLATFPEPLDVVFFANSGSEANDLALRLARCYTGRDRIVALDGAYHGNLQSLIDISPYKHAGPGGKGPGGHAHIATMPDVFRGEHRGPDAGVRYADAVAVACGEATDRGGVSAFIHEGVLSCGGQIPLPPGYLSAAYAAARAHGGVCISDEVQVGFGRVGDAFWAFQLQDDAIPDIITLGKPIGNGHPLSAVVTTRAIADAFANGMEYFNTFGGNPVSCAVGEAVLDFVQTEGLQQRARVLGARLTAGLRDLMAKHPIVADVRGPGLFVGFEMVRDPDTLEPADAEASHLVNRMMGKGFLLSTDGPLHNVIKIKPPLVLSENDVDRTLEALEEVLQDTALRL